MLIYFSLSGTLSRIYLRSAAFLLQFSLTYVIFRAVGQAGYGSFPLRLKKLI